MDPAPSSLSSHASFVVLAFPFFILLLSQLSLGSSEESLTQRCSPFRSNCGNSDLRYPFSEEAKRECGLGIIRCVNNSTPRLIINSEDDDPDRFQVIDFNYTARVIAIQDLKFSNLVRQNRCNELYDFSTPNSGNISFQFESLITYFQICTKGDLDTFVHENHDDYRMWGFRACGAYDLSFYNYYPGKPPSPSPTPPPAPPPSGDSQHACKEVEFPVDFPKGISGKVDDILGWLSSGFYLQWNLPQQCHQCDESDTLCLSEHSKGNQGHFICAAPNHVAGAAKVKSNMNTKVIAGLSFLAIVITSVAILVFIWRKKSSSNGLILFWKRSTRNTENIEAFLRNYGSLAPKRYNYPDIKKMTNSFKDKVGQGGYGGVFKGKLPDGRLVAVKVLNESKGNGEEFINEVASISRTSHVNVVNLLGFCFDGSKRALIFEFMSNGSLEKFIYKTCPHFGWERLYQVAIGIAKGLEYLHRGCNTRILHFDIKPHNILLDDDFCPKISDFGLAKLCPTKDSIISMADARGTIGYIAPEVFSRYYGGVSHKSDVYSYGMMVLEMVGGRKNFDAGVGHTSENYFPDWIYKHIEQGEHLQLNLIFKEKEEEIARKMATVGLWCIQMDPANRPSISKVVDMLEGNLESLSIPPKPCVSSPARELVDSFTSSITS
ncbi:hypothetical protein NE237_005908 [Protea cynaroides]|uniref:Protein kinase domain-containing protein n=1 Tax=Protea cynaroides TaxID=273540 RepID=A0A9Q0QV19_9MAGN|nr:hypothetical protein NE237_005908 [Protea cynaroides]